MVAAAACVLFFTSTLVAVKGWPGLSAPPNSGPVALAPVERAVNPTRERSGEAAAPVVLGARARPAAPTPQVGVGPAPAGPAQQRGTRTSSGAERIGSDGSGPQSTTPITQTETTAPQVQIAPIPVAPPTAPAIMPAVQAPASETQSATPAPTDRRVTVNWPVEDVQTSWSDGEQPVAPQRPPTQRTYMRAPATQLQSWEDPTPQAGDDSVTSLQSPTGAPVRSFAPSVSTDQQPQDGGTTAQPDAQGDKPAADPCPPAGKQQFGPASQPQSAPAPRTDAMAAPATDAAPAPKADSTPMTPKTDSAPAPKTDSAPTTPKADSAPTSKTEPARATDSAPAPNTESTAAPTTEQAPQTADKPAPAAQTPAPAQPAPQQSEPCPPAEQAPATEQAPAPQPAPAPEPAPAPPC
jgi:hypothetical protein